MTKLRLQQYIQIKAEIRQLREQIAELDQDLLPSLQSDGQPTGKNKISRPVEKAAQRREKLLDLYTVKIKELSAELSAIERSISKLPSRERIIIRDIYMLGKTQAKIAEEQNYSQRQIGRIHKRAIERLLGL